MKLAFVSVAGQSVTDYVVSSADIVSSFGESKVGRDGAQQVGVALRDNSTVIPVTVKVGEGIP